LGGSSPRSPNLFRKSVVSLTYYWRIPTEGLFGVNNGKLSLTYDLRLLTVGLRKWSTNWDILSVGDPLADMIGLPGGFSLFFVNFR
jgi:hypothetical protein